ncbi:MAG: TadE/TadG family type IV pilus assembly protein [Gemmataceae bacterium]
MSGQSAGSNRSGNVLVEFALIALVLYFILAAVVEMGRALFAAQVLQQAATVAARELSRTPLPPTGTLRDILNGHPAAQQVFSEDYLVVTPAMRGGLTLEQYFADKPTVNRLLLPLMIAQAVNGEMWVHYPGQLVASETAESGYTVRIPVVQYDASGTATIIRLVPVLEEISPNPNHDPFNPQEEWSPFNLMASSITEPSQRGLIAVRINYPFQAATLTGFVEGEDGYPQPVETTAGDYGPYADPFDGGLGRQAALARNVRPFRKVLSAQAIFRREIFE